MANTASILDKGSVEVILADGAAGTSTANHELICNGVIEYIKIVIPGGQSAGEVVTITDKVSGLVVATLTGPGTVSVRPVVQGTTNAGAVIAGVWNKLYSQILLIDIATANPGTAATVTVVISR